MEQSIREGKERLCDIFYEKLLWRVKSYANGREKTEAWFVTWHLRIDWGFTTSKINYELNKLVNEGKLLKKTSVYWTKFSPKEVDGFYRKDDYFYLNQTHPQQLKK